MTLKLVSWVSFENPTPYVLLCLLKHEQTIWFVIVAHYSIIILLRLRKIHLQFCIWMPWFVTFLKISLQLCLYCDDSVKDIEVYFVGKGMYWNMQGLQLFPSPIYEIISYLRDQIYWSCWKHVFHLPQYSLQLSLIPGSSVDGEYVDECYGRSFRLPIEYTPPLYEGPVYFTPRNGGPRKLLLDNGQVSRFWCHHLYHHLLSLWHFCRSGSWIWQMSGFCPG